MRFPIVLGRFRISQGQLTAFICAALLMLCLLYLSYTRQFHDSPDVVLMNLGSEDELKNSDNILNNNQNIREQDQKSDHALHADHIDTDADQLDNRIGPPKRRNDLKKNEQVMDNQPAGQVVAPNIQNQLQFQPALPAVTPAKSEEKIEQAVHVVGKFDDVNKHVNYSKFLVLQEQVNKMAAMLKEKTHQLKRWSGWTVAEAEIAKYFAVKKRLLVPLPFPWSVAAEDLKALVVDREYFHQLREAVNRTREIALKYQPIYDLNPEACSCTHKNCTCCARIFVKRLKVDAKTCLNFTYTTQGMLKTRIHFANQLAFSRDLATQDAGEICLAASTNLTETCVQFLNVTYTVHPDHRTELRGCVEFHFNVYNETSVSTIASYPVGCFVTESMKEEGLVNKLGNWVAKK